LVLDAHDEAFQFCGGICWRRIGGNIRPAAEAIFAGKAHTV
jgi:hypothetical protein